MSAIASPLPPQMTIEEYLDWEPRQEVRHEYVHGELFAMTGGTIPHNDIALNLYTALQPLVKARDGRINVAAVKVQVSPNSPYYYPDLIVSCDAHDRTARKFIQHPTLIVEVLSSGTESNDRGGKFRQYQAMPNLQEYVLIDSEKIAVEIYRRGEGRMWLYSPYQVGDTIVLSSVEFECPIALLYEGVTLEAEVESSQ
jgi:Uma2 family endonuclease